MIRFLSLFIIPFVMLSLPAMAQENADDVLAETQAVAPDVDVNVEIETGSVVEAVASEDKPIKEMNPDANYEERLKLARDMHEIWPIRPKIEAALDKISEQIEIQERLRFKAGMRKAIQFEALEEASVDAMADIFSAKELEAMIAFYGSKEGRSVSHKTSDYERAIEPVMVKMIDKALLDIKLGPQQ